MEFDSFWRREMLLNTNPEYDLTSQNQITKIFRTQNGRNKKQKLQFQ
jgi:hypothetical protein